MDPIQLPEIRCHKNGRVGNRTEKKLTNIAAFFVRRLQGTPVPQDGDAIILHGRNGVVYSGGHLEFNSFFPGTLSCCTKPYSPYVFGGNRIDEIPYCQASGGYWLRVNKSDPKFVGTIKKWFWLFGEDGAMQDGGVDFCLTVNQWEYTDEEQIY